MSFALSLIFPAGLVLDVVAALVLRATTSPAVAGALQSSGAVIGVLSVAGCLAAIVTGHIALSRAKRYPPRQAGRGLAIAGLVIGYLTLILFAAAAALFVVLILQTPP